MIEFTPEMAKNLQQDENWKHLVKEFNNVIESEKEKMVFAKDEHEMVRCQERVQALRFTIRFPEIIIDREEGAEEPSPILTGGE